ENIGKTNVYIEGDLTDAECVAKLKAEVGSITENIYVGGIEPLTNLTTIELEVPVTVRKIEINGTYNNLKNIKIRGQGKMPILDLKIRYGKKLENIFIEGITELFLISFILPNSGNESEHLVAIEIKDLKNVRKALGVSAEDVYGGTFICNDLEYIDQNYSFEGGLGFDGYFANVSMNKLKKTQSLNITAAGNIVSFPALEEVNVIRVNKYTYNPSNSLIELNFPVLTKINSYLDCKADKLGILNLPLLTYCNQIVLRDQVLPSTTINMHLLNYCTYYVSNIQLPSSGVNAILNKFLNIQPISGKFFDFLQEVAPTGQGLIDKQTLINQGNTVLTN
ncbi:hypothetical protein B0A58_14705, partial [Flavobacterium branchiophilum NBRC 15030 = ATCC 35035]